MKEKKHLKWIIIAIILFELIVLYSTRSNDFTEKIESLAFFFEESRQNQILEAYRTKISKLHINQNIEVLLDEKQAVINFTVVKFSKDANNFLHTLLSNQNPGISLSHFYSTTDTNYKLTYIKYIFFIFVPVFIIWLVIVKPKEAKIKELKYKKLFKFVSLFIALSVLLNFIFVHLLNIEIDSNPQNLNNFIRKETIVAFIFIVIIAPTVEELLFRGLLFRYFIEKKKAILGTLIINCEFVAVHYYYFLINTPLETKFMLFLGIFTISSTLCWIYYKFNSIIAPITLHTINNLFSFVFIYYLL